jgi:colanic acid/amylovoran biosynthesis glycosyltransferase
MTVTCPTAIIYCDHLLYASETFIKAQAGALKRFFPAYAGLRRVKGLELPKEHTHVINSGDTIGRVRELAFKLWGSAPEFVRELRSLSPQLIHAHFGADGFRALPLARDLGLPLVVSFHGSDATVTNLKQAKVPYGHRRYLANKSLLQQGASQVIAVSNFVKLKLLAQGYPEEKVKVHYIGVDARMFSPTAEQSEPFVLFVGRLVERKGVDYLIHAMAEVQNAFPNLELVVIGDGPKRSELEALAKARLRKYRFLGVQSAGSVRDWMGRAAIFAGPSVKVESGEEEGFGIVFIEAQAMEKPVVSFDSGGINEAVEHGVTGYLAPERDSRALAQYLSLLARDPNLRRRVGISGRRRVLRLFDLEKQTALLERLYDDVISRSSVGSERKASNIHGASQ